KATPSLTNMQVKGPSAQKVERRMVVTASDVAIEMASRSTQKLNTKEVERAAKAIVKLSSTQEGRQILGVPARFETHLRDRKFSAPIVAEAVKIARALQNPQGSTLSIREIVKMKTGDAITEYPAAFGSQVLFRSPTIELAGAMQIVDVFSQMVGKDSGALERHSAVIKRELVDTWKMKPDLADAAVQVVDSSKGVMEIIVPS
ncbi:MAG: hypothetical protein KAR32_14675, partial [Candidatus Omnitrophica bacterium]|nr:hypothetical protein [Candidatus Omnitrophota bacterium]